MFINVQYWKIIKNYPNANEQILYGAKEIFCTIFTKSSKKSKFMDCISSLL